MVAAEILAFTASESTACIAFATTPQLMHSLELRYSMNKILQSRGIDRGQDYEESRDSEIGQERVYCIGRRICALDAGMGNNVAERMGIY